ncbi:unnamed protein product, partial [Taenia asiatica]|uniref:Uncharacterized protein n=1 Tax=Taenia asiatica TaxID=60517 RepID=A0A0R3VVU8_TAEAS
MAVATASSSVCPLSGQQGREEGVEGEGAEDGQGKEEEEEEEEEEGELRHQHLLGVASGAAGHEHLVEGDVDNELLRKRHLRAQRSRVESV